MISKEEWVSVNKLSSGLRLREAAKKSIKLAVADVSLIGESSDTDLLLILIKLKEASDMLDDYCDKTDEYVKAR